MTLPEEDDPTNTEKAATARRKETTVKDIKSSKTHTIGITSKTHHIKPTNNISQRQSGEREKCIVVSTDNKIKTTIVKTY